MQRFPSMKIGLASFLSCLALVLGLYTTTGTASAHSAIHPYINVVSSLQRAGNCVSFVLEGGDFTPGLHVDLFASASGGGSISPDRVRAGGDGRFIVDATACQNFAFQNCGSFIESTNFCGFNLPQQDFCGLNGFSGFQTCPFIGSAMKPLSGCVPPWCYGPGGSGGLGGRGTGGPGLQGPQGSPNQPGSQSPQDFTPNGRWTGCQQMDCQYNRGSGNGNHGCQGNYYSQNSQGCFPRVSVFNFCNFHRHGLSSFPFCFPFFRQQFPLQIVITAVDEHTGRQAHYSIGIGGNF